MCEMKGASPFLLEAVKQKNKWKFRKILKYLSICETFSMYLSFHNRPLLDVNDDISMSSCHHGHWKQQRRQATVASCFPVGFWLTLMKAVPLADMQTSLLIRCGSQRNSSRQSMVHWPTTGFLPNGLWSMTFSTMGGVYISSLGRSWPTHNTVRGISNREVQATGDAVYKQKFVTTLRSKTDPGKLGFFLKFLMTAVWTISPPHSTIKLGDVTVASW